jgi:D-glycero-alpha-D-manno-heptose-7-phosphate kinase
MEIQSVLSMAPLRISFLGGGTDISSFYKYSKGCVISAAISKYVYVHVKRHDPLFQERYRISYSEIEYTNARSEIKNKIVKSCLELLNIDEPIQISTSADLPANSGLGSSSSFAVALLNALHALRNESISAVQLAEEACEVEISILGSPIGKQDQFAAAFGGINFFEFDPSGSVRIEPINLSTSKTNDLFNNTVMIWTGKSRSANLVLSDQAEYKMDNFQNLLQLTELTEKFKTILIGEAPSWSRLGPLILEGWKLKQTLSRKIMTEEIISITNILDKLGSVGYKLLGAGGGGFMFAVFNEKNHEIQSDLQGWHSFKPSLDYRGAQIVSTN